MNVLGVEIGTNLPQNESNDHWSNHVDLDLISRNNNDDIVTEEQIKTTDLNQLSLKETVPAFYRPMLKSTNREGVRMTQTALKREICIKTKLQKTPNYNPGSFK